MKESVNKTHHEEYLFEEGCCILEMWNTPEEEGCCILEMWNTPEDEAVSIARARVRPGDATKWHRLKNTVERYVVVEGIGRVEVGDLPPTAVGIGDVVAIPHNTRQRITNTGDKDLIFLCICTPRFIQTDYESLE